MLSSYFFSTNPELLGDTQTVIGVLVTLIVLCLFSFYRSENYKKEGSNNFIHLLFEDFCDGLYKSNSSLIEKLRNKLNDRTSSSPEQKRFLGKEEFWRRVAEGTAEGKALLKNRSKAKVISQTFFQNAQKKVDVAGELMKGLLSRDEDSFVELFLFAIGLLVLMLDGMHVSRKIGAPFLLFLSVQSFCYTTGLWVIYYGKILIKKRDVGNEVNMMKRSFGTLFIIGVAFLVWNIVMGLTRLCWLNLVFLLLIVGIAVLIGLRLRWKTFSAENYNKRLVVKHFFYILMSSTFLTAILLYSQSSNWIYAGKLGLLFPSFFENWNFNTINILNLQTIRAFLVFHLACSAIFVPVVGGFLSSHIYARRAKEKVKTLFSKALKDSEKKQKEYEQIVQQIMDNFS